MALFGLAGFSLYALLPLVNGLNPHAPQGLGAAWAATWFNTKQTLRLLYQDFFAQKHVMGFVALLFFLVPVLPSLIRLQDRGFKNASKVDRLQKRIYRVARVVLLLVCLWLAFDPGVRLQQVLQDQFGISLRLLSFSYVNALGIGFLAGNLLFVLQARPSVARMNREKQRAEMRYRRRVPIVMAVGTALLLLALMARNAPVILAGNWQPLETYGSLAVRSLPAEGGILLGEDTARLAAVQAALPHAAGGARWQVVELTALPSADYRAVLEHRQPSGWLTASNRHTLSVAEEFALLDQLAKTRRLFFLQPGPGELLFERFYPQPNGIVSELKPYTADWADEPPLSEPVLAAGETFWDAAWSQQIETLRTRQPKRQTVWTKISARISRRLLLEPMADVQEQTLAGWYSRSLDAWGVALQRGAKLPAAQRRFEQALALNTNNWSAFVNRQANTNLQAGNTLSLRGVNALNAAFQDLPHLASKMTTCGPVDEPGVCYQLGRYFTAAGWPRQAVQQLERARALAAETLPPEFALLEIYSQSRQDEKVFAGVTALRPRLTELPPEQLKMAALKLDLLEAKSWMSQTNPANASRILQSMLEAHPNDVAAADMVWGAYVIFGDLTNALQLLTKQLADNPENPQLLNNQASLLVMMNRADEAVASLQHSLAITNSTAARLNLALAYFQAKNFSAAETEYHRLEKESFDAFRIHSGLADIALQRQDTNAAIQELELSLTNIPAGSPRWTACHSRLKQFKSSLALGKTSVK
jgi:tetratricopeptide (TPR) repeat protein